MGELRTYTWWDGGELFHKILIKISTLIAPIELVNDVTKWEKV